MDAFRDGPQGPRRHFVDLLDRQIVERNHIGRAFRQHRLQLRWAVQRVREPQRPRPPLLPEMDHQHERRRHPVRRQDAVQNLLRCPELLFRGVVPLRLAPPVVPPDGGCQETPPRHDVAHARLVLQHHQHVRRHGAVRDLQLLDDVVPDRFIPSLLFSQLGDRLRVPLLQGAAHHLEAGLPQSEINQIGKHFGKRHQELRRRIHIFHPFFLINISYSWHRTNIFSSFPNTITQENRNANSLFNKKMMNLLSLFIIIIYNYLLIK